MFHGSLRAVVALFQGVLQPALAQEPQRLQHSAHCRLLSLVVVSLLLGYVLSSSHFFWAKMLVLLAYGTLMMVPSEPKARSSDVNIVKSKVRANFENRMRILRVLYPCIRTLT